MAGNIRWTDGGNTITLSPILGYDSPYRRRESVNTTLSGKTFVHTWSQKLLETVPLINVSAADRDQFFSWWDAKTELTYTPDFDGAPGTTFTAKLMGDEFALQLFILNNFAAYAGSLVVVEV